MHIPKFYMGSILLEKNRWQSRVPSFKVSEWVERFVEDGMEGIELWENHVLRAEDGEVEALQNAKLPIAVYNTYADFSDESKPELAKASDMIHLLKAKGVKFNFGSDMNLMSEYRKNLLAFAESLPKDCVLLCEVHQGTVLEDVDVAGAFFADLPAEKYQIISHVFSGDVTGLQKQFDVFGSRITLAHVQHMMGDQRVCLEADADFVRECVKVMKANGFAGDFTLEFTEGTATPNENIEALYANAKRDMQFIKECWR